MTKCFGLPCQFQSNDIGMAAWSTELRRILNLKEGRNKFVLSAIEADKFTTRKKSPAPPLQTGQTRFKSRLPNF